MTEQQRNRDTVFFQSLPSDFGLGSDFAQQRLFREYGAVFVARGGVLPPNRVVFRNEEDVVEFQSQLDIARRTIGDHSLELQSRAMDKLVDAIAEAGTAGIIDHAARRRFRTT